eukprot:3522145-Amphidinium_carterae.1
MPLLDSCCISLPLSLAWAAQHSGCDALNLQDELIKTRVKVPEILERKGLSHCGRAVVLSALPCRTSIGIKFPHGLDSTSPTQCCTTLVPCSNAKQVSWGCAGSRSFRVITKMWTSPCKTGGGTS